MDDEVGEPLPPLYHACMANDLSLVKELLQGGANPNDGESVYHAAQHNRRDCLELLLAHGADLSGQNAVSRNTPLYFLAGHREGDAGTETAVLGMRWLLEHGADPNVTSEPRGETPLHCLARSGWSATLPALFLAHGADPDLPRGDGRTALVLAERTGNVVLAGFLRSRGARVAGATEVDALLSACMRDDEPEASACLAANPQLLATLSDDDRGTLVQAVYDRREASLRLMVSLGFDLSWEGNWGGTPLHHAAWLGRVAMVRSLLALGSPVNVRDSRFGSSPLAWAAHGSSNCHEPDADHVAVTAQLLHAGSDRATSINRWGEPPESMSSPAVEQLLRTRGFAP